MSYSMYGAGAAVVLIAAITIGGAAGNSNWQSAKGTISTIDRSCKIVETEYDQDFKRKQSRVYTDSCSSIDEWEKVKTKRNKTVNGKAVVHVGYTAPQNGQYTTGELNFDGRDDEFYQLKAGDEIEIMVSKSDPTKIRKS